ncbi:hypothetical protein RR46_02513 [Papilio xuthus]|uniref:Uncharacterized protein n=1 Tax=Papilio xuthus TaxID=66420 RepID=A0A194QMV4_PAPXU|nr:hypothetical protein RR46_02513 [Papilio xuthus]
MSDDTYKCLYNTILLWFSEYHTKISVLLRLGLQNKDGTFNSSTIINPKITQNLGENIYKYDNKKNSLEEYDKHTSDSNEINCLLAHIETAKSSGKQSIEIKLPLEMEGYSKRILNISKDNFEKIQTNVIGRGNDLSFVADIPKSPQEDLLKMLNDI